MTHFGLKKCVQNKWLHAEYRYATWLQDLVDNAKWKCIQIALIYTSFLTWARRRWKNWSINWNQSWEIPVWKSAEYNFPPAFFYSCDCRYRVLFPASYMSNKFIHSCFNCMHANSLDEVIIFYDLLPVTCKSNVGNILPVATGHLEVFALVGHCTFCATIQIVERQNAW